MPRKKKSPVAEHVEANPAPAIVQEIAEATKLPEPAKTHVQRVAEREPNRHPLGHGYTYRFRDRVVGIERMEHVKPYLSIIRFDERPSAEVCRHLRDNGFDWNQQNREWVRPIHFETKTQDKETARRVFDEACKMVRQERGINHEFGG
jgi:hypothetical protein